MSQRKTEMDALGVSLLVGFSILLGLNQALVKLVNVGFSPLFQGGLRSVLAIVFGVGLTFGISLLSFRDGVLLDVATPALGWGVVAVGVVAVTLIERDRERCLVPRNHCLKTLKLYEHQ